MTDHLQTEIDVLDERLGGGIPTGSVVALSASPASQSELLLTRLPRDRRTLYLTTRRTAAAVEAALAASAAPAEHTAVRALDGEAPLEHAAWFVRNLPDGSALVVDPVDPFEDATALGYERFLNLLRQRVRRGDGVAVLHCLDGSRIPARRDTTKYMADIVLQLETAVDGSTVENRLSVPKHRGGAALEESIKLEVNDDITVDTSRRVA